MKDILIEIYLRMTIEERMKVACEILDKLNDDFEIIDMSKKSKVPIFKHLKSSLEFIYISRGNYKMGFSLKEERTARFV